MDRRKAMRTLAVGSVTFGAVGSLEKPLIGQDGGIQRIAAGEYGDSEIMNGASGLRVVANAVDDYSLKAISGDGTKNVTVIRYKGGLERYSAGLSAPADVPVAAEVGRMSDEQTLTTVEEVLTALKRLEDVYKPNKVIGLTEEEVALFAALEWTFDETEES